MSAAGASVEPSTASGGQPGATDLPQGAPEATAKPQTEAAEQTGEGDDDDLSRCPICQFIEAGECKAAHQEWVACRTEAKAAGKDYVEECTDTFKAFLQCTLVHRDYYEPFLEMLGGLEAEEEEGAGGPAEQGQESAGGAEGKGGQSASEGQGK